ncbi:hypothetical protein Fcan01_22855 [Folsomia candida]|uniref:Uncharacterized protein n=1 Tax=Folsomia candida TaxID=158441 RepID=A0A226DB20_FOLCA|nr:hypothetical protein Fcan01_22855 [Folsomia candida]
MEAEEASGKRSEKTKGKVKSVNSNAKKFKRVMEKDTDLLNNLPTQQIDKIKLENPPTTTQSIRQATASSCHGIKKYKWTSNNTFLLDLDPGEYLDLSFWSEEKKRNKWQPPPGTPSDELLKFIEMTNADKLKHKRQYIRKKFPLTAKITKGMIYTKNPGRIVDLAGKAVSVYQIYDLDGLRQRNKSTSKTITNPSAVKSLLKQIEDNKPEQTSSTSASSFGDNQANYTRESPDKESEIQTIEQDDEVEDGECSESGESLEEGMDHDEIEQDDEEEDGEEEQDGEEEEEEDDEDDDEETLSDREFINDEEEEDSLPENENLKKHKKRFKRILTIDDDDDDEQVKGKKTKNNNNNHDTTDFQREKANDSIQDTSTSYACTSPDNDANVASPTPEFRLDQDSFNHEPLFHAYFPMNWTQAIIEKSHPVNWYKLPILPSNCSYKNK